MSTPTEASSLQFLDEFHAREELSTGFVGACGGGVSVAEELLRFDYPWPNPACAWLTLWGAFG